MASSSLRVNGRAHQVEGEPDDSLLSVLRYDLGLTGSKYGCGEGHCGACTVLLDGQPARVVRDAVGAVGRQGDHDDRGARRRAIACTRCSRRFSRPKHSSAATARRAWSWPRSACCAPIPTRPSRTSRGHGSQRLPLRHLSADRPGGPARGGAHEDARDERWRPVRRHADDRRRSKSNATSSREAAALPFRASNAATSAACSPALGGGLMVAAVARRRARSRNPGAARGAQSSARDRSAPGFTSTRPGASRLHRQGRDRPEHPHVARADRRRRAARAARRDRAGDGRHRPDAVRPGHVRIAVDAADGAAAGAGRGHGARDADRPGGRALAGRSRRAGCARTAGSPRRTAGASPTAS